MAMVAKTGNIMPAAPAVLDQILDLVIGEAMDFALGICEVIAAPSAPSASASTPAIIFQRLFIALPSLGDMSIINTE
jgi:hypothetical protein